MRVQTLMLCALVVGCGDDDVGPADAGRDVPADTADVVLMEDAGALDAGADSGPGDPDSGADALIRDVGPNPLRGHRPSMQVIDSDPCEPWEPVASPLPRGLPSDTTPRVLWTYQPSLDPSYEPANARLESRVDAPVVSPDGTIWVRGPTYDQITHLNRDGTMREWFVVGGGNFEDEDNTLRLGDLSVAPNGDVIAIIFARNPDHGGGVVRVDPESTTPHRRPLSRANGLELDPNSRVAISPDGMVYAISQNRVYGICRGERHMWTLTNIPEDGEPDFFQSGYFGGVFILPDGTLQLSGSFARTYEVRGTEVSMVLLFDSANEFFHRQIVGQTPNGLLLQARDPALDGGARFDIGVRVALNEWRAERTIPAYFALNALGEAHLSRSDGVPYRWDALNDVRAPLTADIAVGQSAWQANGGWLTTLEREGVAGLYSLDVAGATRWVFDPFEGDGRGFVLGGQERVLDDQGVYYRVVSVGGAFIQLVAIQTDVLPPPNTMCLDYYGCNAQRDRFLRPE